LILSNTRDFQHLASAQVTVRVDVAPS
jgi:hypothetical protein